MEEHLSAHFQYGATIFRVRHEGYSLEQKCDVLRLTTLRIVYFYAYPYHPDFSGKTPFCLRHKGPAVGGFYRLYLVFGAVHRTRTCKSFPTNCFQGSALTTRTDGISKYENNQTHIIYGIILAWLFLMVGGEGIEPTRVARHWIYSPTPLLTGLPAHINNNPFLYVFRL